jgi:hypothetical protein
MQIGDNIQIFVVNMVLEFFLENDTNMKPHVSMPFYLGWVKQNSVWRSCLNNHD